MWCLYEIPCPACPHKQKWCNSLLTVIYFLQGDGGSKGDKGDSGLPGFDGVGAKVRNA